MGVAMQCYAAFAVSFGSMLMGFYYTWPSYTLELYTSLNTTLLSSPITPLDVSLLGSVPSLGSMVGATIVGPVVNKIGRQKGSTVISLLFPLAWVLIDLTSSSVVILIARFIMGISGGACVLLAPIFIGEVCQDNIRGFLTTAPVLMLCIGSLISYIIGWFLSYRTVIWINILLGTINIVLCYLLIESPIYLIRKGKYDEARTAIRKYKGGTFDAISKELSRLKIQISPDKELLTIKDSNAKITDETQKEKLYPNESFNMNTGQEETKTSALKYLYSSRSSRRAFVVIIILTLLQALMNSTSLSVYAIMIFAEAAPNLSGHLCSVFFACMMCGGNILCAVISDKAGRRVLIIVFSALVALSMTTLGIIYQTKCAPPWVAAVLILVYCFVFNSGPCTVPFILIGECFLPKVQGVAAMMIIECFYVAIFFNISMIPVINRLIGVHGTFYCYGLAAAVNTIVGFIFLPETKGLSKEQIQEAFARKKI